MAADMEGSLDQMMVQVWQQLAMQWKSVQQGVKQDVRQLRQDNRVLKDRSLRQRQEKHAEWERMNVMINAHRETLGKGMASMVETSMSKWETQGRMMPDATLAKIWAATEFLQENSPGYAVLVRQSQDRLGKEWERRGNAGTSLADYASRIASDNVVNVYAVRHTPALQQHLNELSADSARTKLHVNMVKGDQAAVKLKALGLPEDSFYTDATWMDPWVGYDADKIRQATLLSSGHDVQYMDDTYARASQAFPAETAPHDTLTGGINTTTISETAHSELTDNAPSADIQDPGIQMAQAQESEQAGIDATYRYRNTPASPQPVSADQPDIREEDLFDMSTPEYGGNDPISAYSVLEAVNLVSSTPQIDAPLVQPGLMQMPEAQERPTRTKN